MTNNQLHALAETLAGLLTGGIFAATTEDYAGWLLTNTIGAGDVSVTDGTVTVTTTFISATADLTLTKIALIDRNNEAVKERTVSITLTGGGEGAYLRWDINVEEESE